jgi:hypothetical protein
LTPWPQVEHNSVGTFEKYNNLDGTKFYPHKSHHGFVFQVGSLLENTVGHIDPLHVVNKVPAGISIPR